MINKSLFSPILQSLSFSSEYFLSKNEKEKSKEFLIQIIELENSIVVSAEESHDFNVVIDLGASISSTEDQIDLFDNCVTHTLNNPELAERYVNLLDDAWKIVE